MSILTAMRSLTLRTKLSILFSMLVGAILLFMYIYIPARLEEQAEQAQIAKTYTIARTTAFSLSSALFFSDIQTMEEELRGTNLNKDIVYIVIHNDSGRAIVSHNKEQADKSGYQVVDEKAFHSPDTYIFKASTPILDNNKEIGTLYIGMSLNDVIREVDRSRNNIAFISIIVFVMGMFAVYGISSIITKPLRNIVKTIERIAEGDLSHRTEVDSEDEIGHVAHSFNRMVAHVQQAQTDLENLNRTLELRVDERTQELKNEIDERKEAEVKLRESEERYRLLVELSPDAIVIHQNGNFVFMNASGATLFGAREPHELLGKPILHFVHPDYQHRVIERVRAVGAGEIAPMIEEKFVRLDGSIIDVEVAAIPSMYHRAPAVQVVIRDITKRKQAEQALRASEIEMRALFASMRDVILVLDANGTYVKIAPTDPGSLYRPQNELIGKTLQEVMPERAEFLLSYIRLTLETRKTHHVEYSLPLEGKEVWFLGSVSPMTENTVIWVARDITERKLAEKEYRDLEQKLIGSQKLESLGTLAGGIAHDFNNILAIILGYSNIMQIGTQSQGALKQSLNAIDTAVERGAMLVKQILTFAQKANNAFVSLDANVMAKEHAKMLLETFPKFISISLDLDQAVPAIQADPTQFHQTLLNLCVNARDAMPTGGTLTIRTKLVEQARVQERFPEASEHYYVRLSVQDNGTGMDHETVKRIFEPFFTTKDIGKGTGLGLAVVYGIMQSHKGFIDVESELTKGTVFHLYFPIASSLENKSKEQRPNDETLSGGSETILFIEDEEALRALVKIVLEMKGYHVKIATNGEEAIETYRRYQDEIALVFSDMGLPKLSGEQVFYRLKEMKPTIKFIFASGFIDAEKRMELLNAGVRDILQKPYKSDQILNSIRKELDRTSD